MILEKLNLRLILLHLLAAFFFMLAAKNFSILTDVEFFEKFSLYGKDKFGEHLVQDTSVKLNDRIFHALLWMAMFPFIGLFTALIVSILAARRKKIHLINSMLMALGGAILVKTGLLNVHIIKTIASPVSLLVPGLDFGWGYAIDGLLMIAIGMFVFFSKWTNRLILVKPSSQ
ncbi:MAG: hypothetical protein FD123_1735 [Bacteroidetes bacterium]|nr:MAG: hypothetical protein FD123_1735 [Bacteroidota bacterium]